MVCFKEYKIVINNSGLSIQKDKNNGAFVKKATDDGSDKVKLVLTRDGF